MDFFLSNQFCYGGFMDAVNYKDRLYAIQKCSQYPGGRLCVFDKRLNLLESFVGISNARQIDIYNGIAVVTSRESGIWIFDVKNIKPLLLSHYLTIEFATGVTICANYVFISCRQYGIEVIDISDPSRPKHVNIIRVGEVQSACIYNNILFGGIWGEMKVVAVDISDINNPVVITEIPLKGRGDGVVVKENLLYAVSGQHGRNIKNLSDTDDPEFGNGNYVQIFDISDIKNPKCVFCDNLGKAYCMQYDTWRPILCGEKLVCCDSVLGVYVYDLEKNKKLFNIKVPDSENNPVTSIISFCGKLYITSANGIYVFEHIYIENKYKYIKANGYIGVKKDFSIKNKTSHLKQYIYGDYPVIKATALDKYIVLACGSEGIKLVDKKTGNIAFQAKKEGFCMDVKVYNDHIYAAFSESGMAIYYLENDTTLVESSLFKTQKAVQQIMLSEKGSYAAVCLDSTEVKMLDICDKNNIAEVYRRKASQGPLYGDNFSTMLKNDGTMLMFWHRDGLVYSNPENGDNSFKNIFYNKKNGFMSFGPENGCDTDGENIFYNIDGGYVVLPQLNNIEIDELPRYKPEKNIFGKFIVWNNLLISAERARGIITVTNIKNIKKPYTVLELKTDISCGKPVIIDEKIYIPAWHDGLLELIL